MARQAVFGLKNYNGSCWVNACLQGVFRFPELQARYSLNVCEKDNVVDECLYTIYKSSGVNGLKGFFDAVRTENLPAGNGIGDSHELFKYICDKVSFIDNLCRFKIGNLIECIHCKTREVKEDSVIEYPLYKHNTSIAECIAETVKPIKIDDWKCDKCYKKGCISSQLIGSFPKVMVFHMITPGNSVEYSSILMLNSRKYALLAVICYTGGHWVTHARNMPPGSDWFTINDNAVINHGSKQFPLSNRMRMLIYYRLED